MARRRRRRKSQSLTKNIALLFLSLGVLAGASVLFSTVDPRPELYDPIESKLNKLTSKGAGKDTGHVENIEAKKGSAGGFEYSYWDILLLQDKNASYAGEDYSIQIASFKSSEAAHKYASDLQARTHLKCSVGDNGRWFSVRWGSFHTREMAERYCSTLSGRLHKECVVVKP